MTQDQKVNILMVDDQPAKLLSYEVILSELGENLLKATSADEALNHLLRNDIGVVLMDVSMPGIDGFELADMIRQHPRFSKTAMIFISGVHFSDSDKINGYRRGAVDYISVPVVPEVLRAKVSVFVELHRKTRMLEQLNAGLERRVEERTHELRESESQFRTLANSIPQLAWMAHPDGSVFWYNERWCDFTGLPMAELQQSGWSKVQHPDYFERSQQGLQMARQTGQLWEDTFPLRSQTGGYQWFLCRAVPIFDSQGKVARWFGTATDIGAQIAAEEEIRDLNRQLQRHIAELQELAELLELASEAIMVHDLKGTLQFWNSGAEELYGWRREEVVGSNVHQLLGTRFPVTFADLETTLLTGGAWQGNLLHRGKDGREIVVSSRMAINRERNAILEINRDITAEKQAEEALRQAEKLAAMGRVAGIIAHEINNPLESITNLFFLLHQHPSLDDQARSYAALAEQELVRVSHITRETLSFYRDSKQPIAVSLCEVLDSILELQRRHLQLNKITVEKQYRAESTIHGYPVELRQVFLNIITNAIQAMPQGGTLRVKVHEATDQHTSRRGTCVSVFDTGCGITQQDGKQLFEPFFSTKSEKGTGLGLWISKGIVQKYEGSIRFRTLFRSGRAATCFRIFLPTALADASAGYDRLNRPAEKAVTTGHRAA